MPYVIHKVSADDGTFRFYRTGEFSCFQIDTNHANSLSRGGAEVIQVTAADLGNIAASVRDAAEKLPVLTGTSALLADLPTNGEMGQALTSTVALVNEHADENKDAIIAAIPSGSGGSASTYSLNLNIDQVPGTATGTATPQ